MISDVPPGVGVGVGDAVGPGDGDGVGVGETDGVGDGDGVGAPHGAPVSVFPVNRKTDALPTGSASTITANE